jgi:hypothetical protein
MHPITLYHVRRDRNSFKVCLIWARETDTVFELDANDLHQAGITLAIKTVFISRAHCIGLCRTVQEAADWRAQHQLEYVRDLEAQLEQARALLASAQEFAEDLAQETQAGGVFSEKVKVGPGRGSA